MDHIKDIVDEDEAAFLSALHLATASALPMALRCTIDLNLLQLMKDADAPLSASQLAARIPTANPSFAATVIDRILRFLAASSVLRCHLKPSPPTHDEGDSRLPDVERFYSLTPVCKYLTSDEKHEGASLASTSLLIQDRVLMETWYHVKDVVLEGSGVPFDRAYGMNAFEYPATDPRFNNLFNRAMHDSSVLYMKNVLEKYTGFEGLRSLVDVGGGIGASLKMILSKYPTIKAINFDLPHVVQNAPSYPGIEHVGGDMFVGVPKADAIFMKWILHDWSDAHCQKLLKNCYKALPEEKGKVIILEGILPREDPNPDTSGSKPEAGMEAFLHVARADLLMLAYNPGGRERSEEEFESLGKHAGFKQFRKVCFAYNIWIMEFHKGNHIELNHIEELGQGANL